MTIYKLVVLGDGGVGKVMSLFFALSFHPNQCSNVIERDESNLFKCENIS